MFGLGTLFYVSVLLVNALCILHKDRFLARIGFVDNFNQGVGSKLMTLIQSVKTVLTIPLIIANTLIIVYLIILG